MNDWDTIAAIATALGESSVGIVRISGPEAIRIVDKVFTGKKRLETVASHTVHYGHIRKFSTGDIIDEGLVLVMRSPRSYTAEDVVEVQCHGGIVAIRRVLETILEAGARLAEPGEFTKRAFLNGRIDLSQAEAVIDVIRAKTDTAMQVALKQVEGSLSQEIRLLRQKLIELLAHIEVTIDYPEHDVEDVTVRRVIQDGEVAIERIQRILHGARHGRILREGLKTVIVGQPNVGKSSLLNRLSRTERAIVTDIPGTTRDILEESVNIRGIPLTILDTAGIRETEDVVEKIGVERSREAIQDADLTVVVLDGSKPLSATDEDLLQIASKRMSIVIVNKADLGSAVSLDQIGQYMPVERIVHTSIKTGIGLENFEDLVEELFLGGQIEQKDATYATNVRHIALLEQAKTQLSEAVQSAQMGMTLDLVAVDVKNAWSTLGEVIGKEVGEDLLDQIFSQFCLGK
ncbi:tRNA uridine-5-carboxymethylaminomethyl(34) synthesis GTPase MnmE [Fodinisporobacter ferrooxydans]|uniref:tRNA modification GTPase MnmE n=1 Tax=Fodinisporobacter ferrooxydans TaxID=2901836 RepID=A0ABY4CMM9_9BACL|nr:tRNA uridine-5-carboxymethylaminomethyl(34) synthesis GTPase MnmE [Alicyclobacillaceae bacterium MYW30-H2]